MRVPPAPLPSINELLEKSRKLCDESRALREAVKETTLAARSAVDHAKAIRDSISEQDNHQRKS